MTPSVLLLTLVPVAWWVPNHYYPWLAAWSEGLALALLLLAGVMHRGAARLPLGWLIALAVALLTVLVQGVTGRILFSGDAVMAASYLAALGLALMLGGAQPPIANDLARRWTASEAWALGVLVAALGSVALALLQWTGVGGFELYVVQMRPGSRPGANVAQANHLSSIVFLGLCALGVLRESRRVHGPAALLAALFLLFGMLVSGSRTGWVQLTVALGATLFWLPLLATKTRRAEILGLGAVFALGIAAWTTVNEALMLSPGRASVLQQADGGARLPLWSSLLDAVWREPWFGYGWQQVALAQQTVALDHPPLGLHFEHSHNLLLDLALWCGLPAAFAITAAASWGLWSCLRRVSTADKAWWLIAAAGLLVHSMLEYPLEYAYFLVPAGLAVGLASAGSGDGVPIPAGLVRMLSAVLLGGLALVAIDYARAEEDHRQLRLQSAGIGVAGIQPDTIELRVLTQLDGYLRFARSRARPGMSPDELEFMRRVAQRYPYPPMLLRYALASGMNGKPEEASRALRLICSMHPAARCNEGRESWAEARSRFPVLETVAFP